MSQTAHRMPPQDLDAEKAVLGALLINTDAFGNVVDSLRPTDFYSIVNKEIYLSTLRLFESGQPIDVNTVKDDLDKYGKLDFVGGVNFLWDIVDSVPSAANVAYYAQIVHNKAILRDLENAGVKIQEFVFNSTGEEVNSLVNLAQEELFKLTDNMAASDTTLIHESMPSIREMINVAKNSGDVNGVATGIKDLDECLHGLKPGQMVVIAARPRVGKSTLANNIACHAAIRQKVPTVIFNFEMSTADIVMKMLSAEKEIDYSKLQTGRLNAQEWERVDSFEQQMSGVNGHNDGKPVLLYIDDSPKNQMMQIRTKCRKLKSSEHGLGLVILDYLGLMVEGKDEYRQQAVAAMSRKIKLLAKELEVPIILVAQTSRESEKSATGEPNLSHLRESGAIEQDADIVIFVHREELKYIGRDDIEDKEARRGEADIIVAKNRGGEQRKITVSAQLHYQRFKDMSRAIDPQYY